MRTLRGKRKEDGGGFRSGWRDLDFLDQSSRRTGAISGSGRTLRRGTFTEGRTESDFLHCALGELCGHWDEGEMGIWVDGKDGFSERGVTCYPREINVFVAGGRKTAREGRREG